jgi:hypothetical protein
MYRIIYLNDQLDYKYVDSNYYDVVADQHMYLKRCGYKIICIVDYNYNVILNKCRDFQSHITEIKKIVF